MAYYAFIDLNGLVVEVISGKDEWEDGVNWEDYYSNLRGLQCKRTSYNTHGGIHKNDGVPFRKNYAGIGYIYDPIRDAFIPPKTSPNSSLNETTCLWEEN